VRVRRTARIGEVECGCEGDPAGEEVVEPRIRGPALGVEGRGQRGKVRWQAPIGRRGVGRAMAGRMVRRPPRRIGRA
jgi:hypothetical protein